MFFFFSSRRRHTRLTCDWSSDVCSSDLPRGRRKLLAGALSVLIVAGVFGLAFPRIATYGQEWRTVTAMTWPGIVLMATAAAGSLAATAVMIRTFLPGLRLHQAAAVSFSSSAVAK